MQTVSKTLLPTASVDILFVICADISSSSVFIFLCFALFLNFISSEGSAPIHCHTRHIKHKSTSPPCTARKPHWPVVKPKPKAVQLIQFEREITATTTMALPLVARRELILSCTENSKKKTNKPKTLQGLMLMSQREHKET